jgi:hypothetical protein
MRPRPIDRRDGGRVPPVRHGILTIPLPLCVGLVLAAGPTAQAAEGDFRINARRMDQNTVRILRQDVADEVEPAPKELDKSLTVGLAYDRERGGGHSVTTPFNVDWTRGRWYFALSGDGYTRATGDGERRSGPADVSALASYAATMTLPGGQRIALAPEFELTFPTGGEVGSRRPAQDLGLSLTYDRNPWSWIAKGTVFRDDEVHPDSSRYTTRIGAKVKRTWNRYAAFVMLQRSRTRGAADLTEAIAEFDFPLVERLDGAISVARSRRADNVSHLVEFDLSWSF